MDANPELIDTIRNTDNPVIEVLQLEQEGKKTLNLINTLSSATIEENNLITTFYPLSFKVQFPPVENLHQATCTFVTDYVQPELFADFMPLDFSKAIYINYNTVINIGSSTVYGLKNPQKYRITSYSYTTTLLTLTANLPQLHNTLNIKYGTIW